MSPKTTLVYGDIFPWGGTFAGGTSPPYPDFFFLLLTPYWWEGFLTGRYFSVFSRIFRIFCIFRIFRIFCIFRIFYIFYIFRIFVGLIPHPPPGFGRAIHVCFWQSPAYTRAGYSMALSPGLRFFHGLARNLYLSGMARETKATTISPDHDGARRGGIGFDDRPFWW
jgi:hypothetical protein